MIDCCHCGEELDHCDTASNKRTGKITMYLYECGNEDCEYFRNNFHWYDVEGDELHEGLWYL